MGFGLPAAVGAQVARPNDTVVCISGDGSFMMNVQELGTVKTQAVTVENRLTDNPPVRDGSTMAATVFSGTIQRNHPY